MDPARIFDELLAIAARSGLEVRTRAISSRPSNKPAFAGGLCTVLGQRLVLLNSNVSAVERAVALADALVSVELSDLSMSIPVRRFLAERARSRSGLVEPEMTPKPGLAKTVSPSKKKPQHR